MSPIKECIKKEKVNINPIWIMRQAGRYLPEFRKIRKKNPDFIKLCLNKSIVPEITLQPLQRFDFDAAIIFSDILMLPYGMGQSVKFTKGFGPSLNRTSIELMKSVNKDDFIKKLNPVYKSLNIVSKNKILKNKDLIGFIGAPWTILVYMQNRQSPKKTKALDNFPFKKTFTQAEEIKAIEIITSFLKLHVKKQVENGATVIQIFDSWAELLKTEKAREKFIYKPNKELVDYTKKLGVPVICFPRGVENYKRFCNLVKPDAVSIDYNVSPKKIIKQINIPIQGGLNPKVLLGDKNKIKKEALKYLEIFKDHPYIFNLGHGILPETDPEKVKYLVNLVKDFK